METLREEGQRTGVSPQRVWQRRMRDMGRCQTCGQLENGHPGFCDAHYQKMRVKSHAKYLRRKARRAGALKEGTFTP